MKLLLIDESKAKDFLLCVVEIDSSHVTKTRKVVRSVKKKRQSTVHFFKESNARRKQILSVFSELELTVKVFVSKAGAEGQSRAKCLEALILSLDRNSGYLIVMDQDVNNYQKDKGVFLSLLPRAEGLDLIQYRHEEPSQEILLWIPDAIAWASARSGSWKKELAKFKIETTILD